MNVLIERTLDNFQLELYKASIGKHTTDKAKREFMLRLYDARYNLLFNSDSVDLHTVNKLEDILKLSRRRYCDIPMPDYFKATIWILENQS